MNASEPIVLHFTFFLYLFYRPHQNYHSVENKGKFVNLTHFQMLQRVFEKYIFLRQN